MKIKGEGECRTVNTLCVMAVCMIYDLYNNNIHVLEDHGGTPNS